MKTDYRKKIDEWIMDNYPDSEILIADGLEEAFLGVATQHNKEIAVFDEDKCIDILQSHGMSYKEALEYYHFNVTGAYVGENTPVFLKRISFDE